MQLHKNNFIVCEVKIQLEFQKLSENAAKSD